VLGLVFLLLLAVTVTEAAQIVGTLLVLSLTITPAAAAQRLTTRPVVMSSLSVVFALAAADGGIISNLARPDIKASVFVTFISFGIYLICRLISFAHQPARHRLPLRTAVGKGRPLAARQSEERP
jgi:zinc/manganese transport system permease protein